MPKTYKIFPGKKRPDYVKIYEDNRGAIRSYVRRGGVKLGTMKAPPFTERWYQEYYAIMAGQPLPANEDEPAEPGRVRPFTFAALVAEYKRRPQGWGTNMPWCELKPKTQKNYLQSLGTVIDLFGDMKVAAMERDKIGDLLGKIGNGTAKTKAAPGQARNLWTVLRILFSLAHHLKWRPDNLMAGMRRAKLRKGGFEDWTELEVARFAKRHADNADAMWVLHGIAYGCGARSGDFCRLGWDDIRTDEHGNQYLRFLPEKTDQSTGNWVDIPIEDERFLEVLATRPTSGFFLPSREGGHLKQDSLRELFRGWCREARIDDGRKMHGLRKWFACWLMNNDCSEGAIAALLGDTVESIRPYIAAFNRQRAGANGIRKAARRAARKAA